MSIVRPGLEQIDRSGATDGQVPLWNTASDTWQPGDPPAAGVHSVTAGANVTVDATDPANPIVSSTALVPLTTLDSSGNLVFVTTEDGSLITVEV